MVGILFSYWGGPFFRAMLVSGRVVLLMVSASLGGGCPATLAGAATPGGSGFAAGGALGA